MRKSNSYLPIHGTVEAARKKAVKAILAMANVHFPEHYIDNDDAPDEVTRVGYSTTATHNVDFLVPVEPSTCLGFTCPMKSDACDSCKLANK